MKMKKQQKNKILPDGYYIGDNSNPHIITLCQGPFRGLKIQICEDIKIREEYLTTTPQLCYDYRILSYGDLNPRECEVSKSLSRIIAAISVELLYEIIINGTIDPQENKKCQTEESKQ